jgi:virginiamycin A acetyltransferase
MPLHDLIPSSIKCFLNVQLARLRYPGRMIYTPYVHRSAKLGNPCQLNRDVQIGPNVSIGDYTYVNDGTLIGSGMIGKFCSIAYYCEIGMQEHPIDYISTSPFIYGTKNIFNKESNWNEFNEPPCIGNDVWIASKVTILQGVQIGDGAVIAAGSIVTKDVPPYAVVAGAPAKIIRYRFNSSKIESLLALQWWNMSLSELHENQSLLRSGKNWFKLFMESTVTDKNNAA